MTPVDDTINESINYVHVMTAGSVVFLLYYIYKYIISHAEISQLITVVHQVTDVVLLFFDTSVNAVHSRTTWVFYQEGPQKHHYIRGSSGDSRSKFAVVTYSILPTWSKKMFVILQEKQKKS